MAKYSKKPLTEEEKRKLIEQKKAELIAKKKAESEELKKRIKAAAARGDEAEVKRIIAEAKAAKKARQ